MLLPLECYSCADMHLGVAPGFGRGQRASRLSPLLRRWWRLRSPWEDEGRHAARRPPSTRERDGPCGPCFTWLAFRCLDGERDVCGPSFEPVLGVELVIASEVEVSVAIRDWKEKSDLRPNPGNA